MDPKKKPERLAIPGQDPDAGGGAKQRKTPVFKKKSAAVKTISKAVESAESMLALAPNLRRVKLAFTVDRDGTITVSDISFTAQAGS